MLHADVHEINFLRTSCICTTIDDAAFDSILNPFLIAIESKYQEN